MKTCPHCAEQIQEAARICPHCRKKLGFHVGFMGGCLLLVVGGIAFVAIISTLMEDMRNPSAVVAPKVLTPQEKKALEKLDAMAKAKAAADEKKFLQTKAGRICTEHPEWSRDMCKTIADRKIYVGMTPQQVVAAWGRPSDINRTTFSSGTHEQWVYGSSSYVYFERGAVTAIQH